MYSAEEIHAFMLKNTPSITQTQCASSYQMFALQRVASKLGFHQMARRFMVNNFNVQDEFPRLALNTIKKMPVLPWSSDLSDNKQLQIIDEAGVRLGLYDAIDLLRYHRVYMNPIQKATRKDVLKAVDIVLERSKKTENIENKNSFTNNEMEVARILAFRLNFTGLINTCFNNLSSYAPTAWPSIELALDMPYVGDIDEGEQFYIAEQADIMYSLCEALHLHKAKKEIENIIVQQYHNPDMYK